MKLFKMSIVVLLVVLLGFAGPVFADKEMSKEEQEMMKKFQAFATPGESHKVLEFYAGKWDIQSKYWMKPGDKPIESKMENVAEMILGGRYLKSVVKGNYMGMPFEGHNIIAYDNHQKVYLSTWIDNMGTSVLLVKGTTDKTGKIMTLEGTVDCIITGGKIKMRTVAKIVDKNKYTYEIFQSGGMFGPKEFKAMEMVYLRK